MISASGGTARENSALPTARDSRKRKVNKILLSSDDEEVVEEVTPPPKKKSAVAPAATSRERVVQSQSKQVTSSKVNAKKKKRVNDYESSADEETADNDSDFMDVDEDEKVKKVIAKNKRSTKSTNDARTGKGRVERKSKEDLVKEVEGEDKDSNKPKPKFKYETFPFLR